MVHAPTACGRQGPQDHGQHGLSLSPGFFLFAKGRISKLNRCYAQREPAPASATIARAQEAQPIAAETQPIAAETLARTQET